MLIPPLFSPQRAAQGNQIKRRPMSVSAFEAGTHGWLMLSLCLLPLFDISRFADDCGPGFTRLISGGSHD